MTTPRDTQDAVFQQHAIKYVLGCADETPQTAQDAPRTTQDTIFRQIVAEFREMNRDISGLRGEMGAFRQALEPITRIVRGDGAIQSIGTQIELVKQLVAHIQIITDKILAEQCEKIKKMEEKQDGNSLRQDHKIKDVEDKVKDICKEDMEGKWKVIAAIITGTLGLAGTIAAIIIVIFKR